MRCISRLLVSMEVKMMKVAAYQHGMDSWLVAYIKECWQGKNVRGGRKRTCCMHAWKRLHYAKHGSFRLTKVSKDIGECLLTRSRLEVHVQCTASWQNFLLTCYYPTVGLGFMDISTGVKQIAPVQRCPCASGNAIFIPPRLVSN